MKQNSAKFNARKTGGPESRAKDLRVIKTLELIRETFCNLVAENSFDELTVSALCQRAKIGRKTFYTYYASLDALFEEVLESLTHDYLETIKDFKAPEDIERITRKFYEFSSEAGDFYNNLVCSESYQRIGARLIMRLVKGTWINADWFHALNSVEQDMLLCFIYNSGLGLYRQWIMTGKEAPMEKMIAFATILLGRRVEGFKEIIKSDGKE